MKNTYRPIMGTTVAVDREAGEVVVEVDLVEVLKLMADDITTDATEEAISEDIRFLGDLLIESPNNFTARTIIKPEGN